MTVTMYRAAIAVLLITVAVLAGHQLTQHHTAPAPAATRTVQVVSDDVTSYNDGFTDSKADDCQQGFAAACQWAHSN